MQMRAMLVALVAVTVACAASERRITPPSATPPALGIHVEQQLLATVRVRDEPVHSTLAARMAEHRVPGVSIAVFDDYELVWAAAYGVADSDTGELVRDTTLFQAGSISKSVNALAVMLVAADGKLELDAPINDVLRSWKLPSNELTRASPVTLRRLLSHNAGTTVHGFPGYRAGTPVPTLVQVLDGAPPANTPAVHVDVAPGSIVRYSGGGTTITQLALVDTLGEPYPTILEQRVLAPLGMVHSTYEQPLPAKRLAHAAAGHHRDGKVVPGKHHVYPEMAAAGLWTTPTDLARFFAEVTLARANRSKHVTRSIAEAMTTALDSESGAGLGFFMAERNGAGLFGHGGADEGFQALATASLEGGYGVVVMANSDNGFRLFPEIERTVFAAMDWPAADPPIVRAMLTSAQRDRLLGSFHADGGPPFSITATVEGLALARPFLDPVELVPVSVDRLVRVDDGRSYTFTTRDTVEIADAGRKVAAVVRLPASATAPLFDLADGGFEEAVAAWKDLLRREPDSALAGEQMHLRYAFELLFEDRVDSALIVLQAAVAVFPDSAETLAVLAHALATKGDQAAAIATFEQALGKLDADPRIPAERKATWRSEVEAELVKVRGGPTR